MSEEKWIEFDGIVRDIGNKGKSRGFNLSAYTNELDIGRHIVGQFRFVDEAPDSTEYHERKKQTLLTKRLSIVQDIKTFCAQNKLSVYARKYKIPEEQALTLSNLNSYLDVWAHVNALNQPPDESFKEQQQQLLKQIELQLRQLSIDVHVPYTLRGKEGAREQYPVTEYAIDEELECVVHKDNVDEYRRIKAEYVKVKQSTQKDSSSEVDAYLGQLTLPSFIIEAVIDDIETNYTTNALQQLNKRVDAYVKDPTALLKRKRK